MPVDFTPEPEPIPSSAGRKIDFTPEPEPGASGKIDFTEEAPPSLGELERRMGNLAYDPTDDEILRYKGLKKGQLISDIARYPVDPQFRIDKTAALVGQGLSAGWDLAKTLGKGGWAIAKNAFDPVSQKASDVEGAYRAGRNAREFLYNISRWVPPIDEQGSLVVESPEAQRSADLAQFRLDREEQRQSARLAAGKETLAPGLQPMVDPAQAEALGIVLDPTMQIPFGLGLEGAAAKVLGKVAGNSLEVLGKGIERAGQTTAAGIRLPEKLIGGARKLVASDAELAAADAVKVDAALGSAASRAASTVAPETTGFIKKWTDRAASLAETAQQAGPALEAIGRNVAEPAWSAQVGVLRNVARDASAPDWVRRWAQAATPLDPLISGAGHAASGGLQGAAIGGTIGALTGGEEGLASGAGGGGVAGIAGGLAGGLSRRAREARVQADLTRWMDSLSPEHQAAMASSGLTSDQAVRVMNAQKFISGLGDVDFKYLTDAEWKAQGLTPARAMEVTPGDRPLVRVNVDRIADGASVLHETGHVLRRLMPEQFAALDRALFSDFTVGEGTGKDFTTGRTDTSGGILSPEQQQKIYDAYFATLDPKTQAERLAAWSRKEHLASLREEVTSNFLSSLLQNKRPDYLVNIGGLKSRLLGALSAHEEAAMLSRIPGLDAINETRDATGRSTFTQNGRPLNIEGRAANELRKLLSLRDRITRRLFADVPDNAGISGIVSPREIAADKSGTIAKIYGNAPTFAKDPVTGNLLRNPDDTWKINDNGAIAKLDKEQGRQLHEALRTVPAGPGDYLTAGSRQLEPMTLQPNGKNWAGDYFTDAQLAAIARVVDKNLISPEHLRHIVEINNAIKAGQGDIRPIKYFPATKEKGQTGRRRYAPLGQKGYAVSPYGFFINKEGGLSLRAFDVGSVNAKLNRWMSDPKTRSRLSIWNGDRDAAWNDIHKYLDNQAKGRLNDLNLDPNPIIAVQKRNLISDLLIGKRVNPSDASRAIKPFLSTDAGKDNPVKFFRVDRIGDIGPNTGQNFRADYFKIKENLMPLGGPDAATGPLPPGVTPGAVIRHTEAQAVVDLRRKLVSGGAPPALADDIAATAWKKAEKAAHRQSAPHERAYTVRAAERLNQLGPADMEAIRTATIKGGTAGAAKEIEKRLLVAPKRGHRMPVGVK